MMYVTDGEHCRHRPYPRNLLVSSKKFCRALGTSDSGTGDEGAGVEGTCNEVTCDEGTCD